MRNYKEESCDCEEPPKVATKAGAVAPALNRNPLNVPSYDGAKQSRNRFAQNDASQIASAPEAHPSSGGGNFSELLPRNDSDLLNQPFRDLDGV